MRCTSLTRDLESIAGLRQSARGSRRAFTKKVARNLVLELLEDRTLLSGGAPSANALLGAYGQIPLSFEANQGQADLFVNFLSHGSGYNLSLTPSEAVLSLQKPASHDTAGLANGPAPAGDVLHMRIVGANPDPTVLGLDPQIAKSNYYTSR